MSGEGSRVTPYELFALGLSLFALILLGVQASIPLDAETGNLIDLGDLFLCGFFFLDFIRNLAVAPSKTRYLLTWGWLDLAASIPAVDVLRLGRLGRVVRILRVLRVIKAARVLALAVTMRRRESAMWAAGLIALLVIFTASIAVLQFERRAGGNIETAEDALWWAMTTITTVGYGDRYPVTTEGRLVAVGLMAVGVGLFGTLSGVAASWFVQPPKGTE